MRELYQNNPAAFRWIAGIVIAFLMGWFFWWLPKRRKPWRKKGFAPSPDSVPPQGPLKSKEVMVGPVKMKKEYYPPQESAMAEPTPPSEGETEKEKEVRALLEKGDEFHGKGDFNTAIYNYTKAIDKNPIYASAFNNRGNAYAKKKDYDTAIRDYTKAIELDPILSAAFYNRGNAYAHKKDYDTAIRDYNKTIELDPNFALAFYDRGTVCGEKGDYDTAIRDFNKAIELNPNYALAMANMGVAYYKKGNKENARLWWEKTLEKQEYLPDGGEAVKQWIKELEE